MYKEPGKGFGASNYYYNAEPDDETMLNNFSKIDKEVDAYTKWQRDPVTTGEWLLFNIGAGLICLLVSPLLYLLILFGGAFSRKLKPSLRNYCRASLIMAGVVTLLIIIFSTQILAMLSRMMPGF